MRTPILPLLSLPPLLACTAGGPIDTAAGAPVAGAAIVSPDCAPDDGPAFGFDIGMDADACDATRSGPWLRVTVWADLDPMAGGSWDLDPAAGVAQVMYFADPSANEWVVAASGTFSVETWSAERAAGAYDVVLEDGTHLAGPFDASYCDATPACG